MTGDLLRKIIAVAVFAVAAAGVYYRYEDTLPCVHSISYRLGAIDTRFGESEGNLLAATKKATEIWNGAAEKTLFVYDPNAKLAVNLIYDTRQQNAELGSSIEGTKATLDAQRAEIAALEKTYEAQLADYNQQVAQWNSRGGAPANVFRDLQNQKAALASQLAVINSKIAALNAETRQTNQTITTFNQNAGEFEEGQYVRDASGVRIDVFEFTSTTQLVRLLAHEFGHALGLEHNQDPSSIMYPVNRGKNLSLSSSDLADLKSLCNL